MTLRNHTILSFLIGLSISLVGCAKDSGDDKALIVATTGHIHDALENITKGLDIELKLLCGPGVDPHFFRASTKDVEALDQAKAIVANGFHLEAKLAELFHSDRMKNKVWSMSSSFPADARLDWLEDGVADPEAPFDPHIWNCLTGWAECVKGLTVYLGTLFPDYSEQLQKNGLAYAEQILENHEWASEELATLPKDKRFLVSAHDAFNYFAKAYGLETVAVLGIGNDPEADIQTMIEVAEVICQRQVPVIFMESMTNPKVTTALKEACQSRDWEVKIASQKLYSDDLGEAAPQNNYLGAFRSNVETIVTALGTNS